MKGRALFFRLHPIPHAILTQWDAADKELCTAYTGIGNSDRFNICA